MPPPLGQSVRTSIDKQIRADIKSLHDSYVGDLMSRHVHADLKPWVAVIQKLAQEPIHQPMEFINLYALNQLETIVQHIETSGEKTGLPSRLINEYNIRIKARIAHRIAHSQEQSLFDTVEEFGQDYAEDARNLRNILERKGNQIPNVKACVDGIDTYLKTLGSLMCAPAVSDSDYTPQMDILLAEIAKPNSVLHYRDSVFGTAERILKYYNSNEGPLQDKEMGEFIPTARKLNQEAVTIFGEILATNNSRQVA